MTGKFLLEALEDLDTSLRTLNSRLFVVRGQHTDVFPLLFKEWNVTRLTFECDSEPYGTERDATILKMAQEFGVETRVRNSHTLYKLARIIEMNNDMPPLTFKRFQAIVVHRLELPKKPLPTVTRQQMDCCQTGIAANHDERYGVPSLDELGFKTHCFGPAAWRGRETEAGGKVSHLIWVFEELLLDADWSVNAGSWLWLSCSSFFQQFFHCYCPVGFGRRTDPSGDYIRR
ncbi:cryptochrome-2-like [Oncorhynchus keta]|uniref:cryptochrome-2-like n=1 Tax=Oncorhynchus keta TaxID=8018 RepID=UPI00227B7C64|nr:cryptochrome-2-like [Oncorhynchus keta]